MLAVRCCRLQILLRIVSGDGGRKSSQSIQRIRMPRHSDEAAPRNILQFPYAKGRPSLLQETQIASPIADILNRLLAENVELRGKAVDLMLQIQSLRDRDCRWDRNAS
jgi:hypothetical protein